MPGYSGGGGGAYDDRRGGGYEDRRGGGGGYSSGGYGGGYDDRRGGGSGYGGGGTSMAKAWAGRELDVLSWKSIMLAVSRLDIIIYLNRLRWRRWRLR